MRARIDRKLTRSWRAVWLLPVWLLCGGCTAFYFSLANLPASWAPVERVRDIAYGDAPRQRLDLYRPKDGRGRGQPLLVFYYGGAWDEGDRDQYRFVGTVLAQLGYVTIVPDYRLYPAVRFPEFLDDGARAVAWARSHAADYGADPRRIVLLGHSAGAHMAAMLSIDGQYLRRAGVDPADIAGFVSLSGPHDLQPDTPVLKTIFAAPFTPREWQVVERLQGSAPPALLLHGATDTRVWPAASERLAEQLRAMGSDVTLRIYPDCDHVCPLAALSVPARSRAPALRDIRVFLGGLSAKLGSAGRQSTAVQ